MGIQSLYTAATGMEALQIKLDTIANNLANANTTAFKKDRCNFEDLFYQHMVLPGLRDLSGQLTPTGINVGMGSKVQSIQTDFSQGQFRETNRPLDVAIVGTGFFSVQDPTGQIYYTRSGNFSLNDQGQMVMGSATTGRPLDPPIQIPITATDVSITANGDVYYREQNSPTLQSAGNIQLTQFLNPQGLLKLGENLYGQTDASGPPTLGIPGQQGLGSLRQNFLEWSNVEPVEELIDLITTQRGFELNSQVVQASDQLLQLIANLRRN